MYYGLRENKEYNIGIPGIGFLNGITLDRRHHRYSSGSDSLQSTNSFTSFINVINLSFFSWGKNKLFLIQVTCRLLASIITGQILNKLFLTKYMTYLLFFIKILY